MVTRLSGAVLEIDAFGTTGEFVLRKDFEKTANVTRTFIVGDRAQLITSLLDRLSDATGDLDFGQLEGGRRGFYLDGGTGKWSFELQATLSETPVNGEYLQMGDSGDETTLTKLDATGADARTQAEVLQRWVREARTDSENPARLHIGHYHDGTHAGDTEAGLFETPLPVVIPEGPQIVETSEESSSVDVSLTCVVALSVDGAMDGQKQLENDLQ